MGGGGKITDIASTTTVSVEVRGQTLIPRRRDHHHVSDKKNKKKTDVKKIEGTRGKAQSGI